MNKDILYKMLFMGLVYGAGMGLTYLYGRKSFPKLSLWLSICTWILMMILSYYNGAWIALFVILGLTYMFILRKPNQVAAFKTFYADNNIYSTEKKYPQAVLDILGDKKWRYAEGLISKNVKEKISYGFWQGSLSSSVSAGQYTRTTVYTYYLAFIFPPGSASNIFKQIALASADRSHYTLKQKIKFFFTPDTETPNIVRTAADGSFIIQYTTIPDVEHYEKRVNWLRENFGKLYLSAQDKPAAEISH